MNNKEYEKAVLVKVSPLQVTSNDLLTRARAVVVTNDDELRTALAIKKDINAHAKNVNTLRLELTRPLDQLKKFVLDREREITNPLNEAKASVSDKVLGYEEEIERAKEIERQRIETLALNFSVEVRRLTSIADIKKVATETKNQFINMSILDRENLDIKLAFTTLINNLVYRKEQIEDEERANIERQRQDEEAKRLRVEADKQNAEQRRMAEERAVIEIEKRRIEDEKQAIEREKRRQDEERAQLELEKAAETKRKEEAAAEAKRPKTNTATYMDFEIEYELAVPRELCSPDAKKIREAIKAGSVEISGIRIFETKKVR